MHRVVPAMLVAMLVIAVVSASQSRPVIEVYKTATCGCCGKWVEHLQKHGFSVRTTNVQNLAEIKTKYNVPGQLGSCHTGVVQGYVIEGHVPATDVLRLLQERPTVVGIAVPGMPMGSPGMEGPEAEAYQVVSFDQKNQVRVFSSHKP
jgi:hypothetical protein